MIGMGKLELHLLDPLSKRGERGERGISGLAPGHVDPICTEPGQLYRA